MLTPVCRADFRHTCEQNEGMLGYGWDEYDTRTGGRQVVHDSGNKIDLTTEFVKIPGGTNGGNWAVRIKGSPRDDASADLKTTVVFYATVEGLGSLSVEGDDALGFEGDVTIEGKSPELGEFKIDITTGSKSNKYPIHAHPSHREKPLDRTRVDSLQLPDQALWQAKGRVLASQNQGYRALTSYLASQLFCILSSKKRLTSMWGNMEKKTLHRLGRHSPLGTLQV